MNMWKRVTAGAAAAVALALVPAAAVSANVAAPDDANWCDNGKVCFWTAPGYAGERSDRDNAGPNCDSAPDGVIRSIRNWSGQPVWLYAGPHCEYLIRVVPHGTNLPFVPGAHSWR